MGLFRRRNLAGASVFITGAASGIGKATALAVAAKGGELFLTDVGVIAQIGADTAHTYEKVAAVIGAVFVVGVGLWLNYGRRREAAVEEHSKT